jgi:hypothetical protein
LDLCCCLTRPKQPTQLNTASDIKALLDTPTISVLDLKNNKLNDVKCVDVLAQMPNLKVLYLKGNPMVKKIKNYRRTLISRLRHLTYLDERPVFDTERKQVEAWAKGTTDVERTALLKAEAARQRDEKDAKRKENFEAFDAMMTKARADAAAKKAAAAAAGNKENDTTSSSAAAIATLSSSTKPVLVGGKTAAAATTTTPEISVVGQAEAAEDDDESTTTAPPLETVSTATAAAVTASIANDAGKSEEKDALNALD